MSQIIPSTEAVSAVSEPSAAPAFEAMPGRASHLAGLSIRRLLPRSQRRLVGPWCFLDSFGPLSFLSEKPMDVAPHPHIGLQTVSWLLEGEVVHNDSLGKAGLGSAGTLNLMTAGSGIAHTEETPPQNSGRLWGVQLWVALPRSARETEPGFEQHSSLPVVQLAGGQATVVMGELGGVHSPAQTFSPLVAADVSIGPRGLVELPIKPDFEQSLLPLSGTCRLDGHLLSPGALYYLGCGRETLPLESEAEPCRVLLLGGTPFGESIVMWWNFVARTSEELLAAREDWQAGRRFGEVRTYQGQRFEAPPFVVAPSRKS